MAYERNIFFDADSGSGAQGKTLESPILFSEIFDGVPQFYAGSTICVQEILTIISNIQIGKEHLVDVDMRWFNPKVYFGTYQLTALINTPLEPEGEGGQGFITNQTIQIKRYSNYTITANPNNPISVGNAFKIDNCNFELEEVTVSVGTVEITTTLPKYRENLLTGLSTNEKAPLADTEYNQFFTSIGLYYNPGCEPVALNHRVAVINVVYTDFLPYPDVVCRPAGG